LKTICILTGRGMQFYDFDSAEQARAEYERVKKEMMAGNKTFEISDKDKCDLYLMENVISIGLFQRGK
jgi:hypothetical protein